MRRVVWYRYALTPLGIVPFPYRVPGWRLSCRTFAARFLTILTVGANAHIGPAGSAAGQFVRQVGSTRYALTSPGIVPFPRKTKNTRHPEPRRSREPKDLVRINTPKRRYCRRNLPVHKNRHLSMEISAYPVLYYLKRKMLT